jgi:hypothetical protein
LSGNAGAVLLRAVDDAIGVTKQIARDLHDPRNPVLTRYGMTELLRTRLQMIALGHRDQRDADLLRRDPALRLSVSDRACLSPLGDASLASQPTMSRLIDTLAIPSNLARMNKGLLDGAIRCGHQGRGLGKRRATIDVDSFPIGAHGHQPGSEWNRHYGMRCFHPLIAMLDTGHWLGVELRPGNAHTAAGITDFLEPILDGVEHATGQKPRVRGDVLAILKRRKEENEQRFPGSPWVFSVHRRKQLVSHIVEVDEQRIVDGKRQRGFLPSPHRLRDTFLSAAHDCGVWPLDQKALANHALPSSDITEGYIRPGLEHLREVAEKIAAFLLGKAGQRPAVLTIVRSEVG